MQRYPYIGDTGYDHMDLGAPYLRPDGSVGDTFWDTAYAPNADSELTLWLTIGETTFATHPVNILPVRTMAACARACKWFFSILQRRLAWCRDLRLRWGSRLAARAVPYLVYRTHPFKYTGRRYQCLPINWSMGVLVGLQLLSNADLGDMDAAPTTRYAMADVRLFVTEPISFTAMLYVAGMAIAQTTITYADYIYLPDDEPTRGQWLAPLRLPTRFNPLTLGAPILDKRLITLCLLPAHTSADAQLHVLHLTVCDPTFIFQYFTHVLIEFRTVDALEYDWEQYAVAFNGELNTHAWTTSLVRHKAECVLVARPPDGDIDPMDEVEQFLDRYFAGLQLNAPIAPPAPQSPQ